MAWALELSGRPGTPDLITEGLSFWRFRRKHLKPKGGRGAPQTRSPPFPGPSPGVRGSPGSSLLLRPAGLSPSLQSAYSIASHPVRRSSLRSWFIHTAWKGAGAGLRNTNPRICCAEERGNWWADNKWHWGLSVQMVGIEHVTSGRRKFIKTRAVVTQGPVMVPPPPRLSPHFLTTQPHSQKVKQ